jgi:hypothetical protein
MVWRELYIDDLGLCATTFEEYLQRLQSMLGRLDSYDIRLNGGICQFGQKSMDFLQWTSSIHQSRGWTRSESRPVHIALIATCRV